MNDSGLNILGICRRAGKLSMGRDKSVSSILSGRARLCLVCSDASDRIKREFKRFSEDEGQNFELIFLDKSIDEMHRIIGFKAGVLTVDDDGFAKTILKKQNSQQI